MIFASTIPLSTSKMKMKMYILNIVIFKPILGLEATLESTGSKAHDNLRLALQCYKGSCLRARLVQQLAVCAAAYAAVFGITRTGPYVAPPAAHEVVTDSVLARLRWRLGQPLHRAAFGVLPGR